MGEREGYEVLRLIEHNQKCYISSDYVEGKSLIQWLKYHPNLTKKQLFLWIRDLADQLECIHKCRGNPCYQYVNPYSMIIAEDEELYFLDLKAASNQEMLIRMQKRTIREHVKDKFWANAEETVRKINEKTNCKATLYDLADLDKLKEEIADSYLFANATGMGMKPLEGKTYIPDKSFFRPDLIVTDVVYFPRETEMLRMAKEVGCKTMNGLGMMLFQGSAAFELWTGQPMPIEYMKDILDIKYE